MKGPLFLTISLKSMILKEQSCILSCILIETFINTIVKFVF